MVLPGTVTLLYVPCWNTSLPPLSAKPKLRRRLRRHSFNPCGHVSRMKMAYGYGGVHVHPDRVLA